MNNPTYGEVQAPNTRRIERRGASSEAYSERYPRVFGGVCEFCGVVDPHSPSEYQYKMCSHFRGLGDLACSYCPETKNQVEVVGHSTLNVAVHPDNPDKLVVWCDSFECSGKHLDRFKVNR